MKRIEWKFHKSGIWIQVLIILILTLAIFFIAYYHPGKSCTIFTAVQGDRVLYGNSEDQHNPDPVIVFFPPSSEGYGSVHFGITRPNGEYNFEGAVNDQGLAWDCNSTPRGKLDPDPNPGKPYYLDPPNYLYTITKKAATVDDAIQIAKNYHFGDVMEGQYHIADANGDAVVISAGADGKIAVTHKDPGENYLLSTNFNLAQPEKGPVDFRWETADGMLATLGEDTDLSPEYAGEILGAVHLNTLTSYTLYSNVLDLKQKTIYLNYMAQFNETAVINMKEEFSKGQRIVEMRDFFSPATATAGDAAYQRFALRFNAAKTGVIAVLVGLFFLTVRGLYWKLFKRG